MAQPNRLFCKAPGQTNGGFEEDKQMKPTFKLTVRLKKGGQTRISAILDSRDDAEKFAMAILTSNPDKFEIEITPILN